MFEATRKAMRSIVLELADESPIPSQVESTDQAKVIWDSPRGHVELECQDVEDLPVIRVQTPNLNRCIFYYSAVSDTAVVGRTKGASLSYDLDRLKQSVRRDLQYFIDPQPDPPEPKWEPHWDDIPYHLHGM